MWRGSRWARWCRSVAERRGPVASAAAAVVGVLAGCEVNGLVGSNVSVGGGGSGVDDGSSTGAGSTDVSVGDGPSITGASSIESSAGEDDDGDETSGVRFDLGQPDAPASCDAPLHESCDANSDDPFRAMGFGCPGGAPAIGTMRGHPAAMTVHEGKLGTSSAYPPREGERFVVLSTGIAEQLAMSPAELVAADPSCNPVACPSTQHGAEVLAVLPEPIDVRPVSTSGIDCIADSTLVGEGDCSNSLFDQFVAGSGALDYVELRVETTVPAGVDGFSYDFAFFSVEYPSWIEHASPFNDMYVAWLQSEEWTGNVSFDEFGHPISVTGVFLDYKDAPSAGCPAPCSAPELAGFAMEGHAGTKWLETSAGVRPGEDITLVFTIFDLTDGAYDSMAVLDNFEWTCGGAPPFTQPVG